MGKGAKSGPCFPATSPAFGSKKMQAKFVPLSCKSLELQLLSQFFYFGGLATKGFPLPPPELVLIEKEEEREKEKLIEVNDPQGIKITVEAKALPVVSEETQQVPQEFLEVHEDYYDYDYDYGYDFEYETMNHDDDGLLPEDFLRSVVEEEEWLWEEGEEIWNKKRNESIQRSKAKNKNKKVRKTHVNALKDRKEQEKRSFLAVHFEIQKWNGVKRLPVASRLTRTPPSTSLTRYTPLTPAVNSNNPDADFQRALQLSLQETQRNPSLNTQIGLTPQQIAQLQTRDLTPEDYELLLLLDKSVKPKTVETKKVKGFPVVVVDQENLKQFEGSCTVCLVDFEIGDKVKTLPCKHYFHENCIDTWLTTSSVNCPIDGLSVAEK
eukprot:TRINITY_DN957_c0_g1_i1.p1 TRINITY_DN957_c0_g1~~TRINITY_DN957_c0_g1_i1.p1  ORF type:complete len:380 (+),score=117.19 TRINITY_DN957_c0_g1_i1:118-1257(+)